MAVNDRSAISAEDMHPHRASDLIRTRSCATCYLCGAVGILQHENLKDQLFGASGTWNLKRCPNPSCGLIWLDPMPIEADIGKAYEHYYTHADQPTSSDHPSTDRAKAALTRAYELCWRFTPLFSERQELELMCLGARPAGRMLEVGCGDGHTLAQLRALGWDVHGQELDQKAASHARTRFEVPVFCGPLDKAGFRDAEFDAVVTNHVLEHVHDPLALLRESKRILKPGGILVAITPNARGWGHARFGACWRGLEPPRHLFLFSPQALEKIARSSGFQHVKTWTTAARSVWTVGGSLRVERGQAVRGAWPLITRAIRQAILHAAAVMAHRRDPETGDECVLMARS
jgi:SAM-dependent methyltransferase